MSTKKILLSYAPFTLLVFLANQFLVHPDNTAKQNLLSAAISGVLFVVVLIIFNLIKSKRH